MALIDLSLEELREYRPERTEPTDFDQFWTETLAAARSHPLGLEDAPVETGLRLVDSVDDVTFAELRQPGRSKAWLVRPAGAEGPLPVVVEYRGYGGGRGLPHELLYWSLRRDTRT